MFPPQKVLVVDHNSDSGSLLVRALSRKFPNSAIQLTPDAAMAIAALATENIDVVVLHRTEEMDAVTLVRALREVNRRVPIIAVSGLDRSEAVLQAGATGFMKYDEWLMIGTVVANAMMAQRGEAPQEASVVPFPLRGKTG